MRSRILLLAGLLAAFAATASAATSPKELYRSAIIAAGSQHSVHYVSTSKLGGNAETMVGDAALDRGIQRITFRKGGRTGHVTVIVVANTAYVRGDAFALAEYLGFTSTQASQYAGRWVYMKPPGGAYVVVAEAVRFRSFVEELLMPAPYTAAPATTVAGHRATGARSRVTRSGQTATLTLYVAAGSPLPVEQVAQGSTGTITTTLSRWNEPVSVVAPSGAVAFR